MNAAGELSAVAAHPQAEASSSTTAYPALPACALITPAWNEAALITETIKAVVAQTVRPAKWVIVSDGSTDGTDDIVKQYAAQHGWIELVQMPQRAERHFAGKVNAFKAGQARLQNVQYDVIGNLDADITFETDYLEFLLGKFLADPKLGVAGTPFREGNYQYDYRFTSSDHVSGACQLFRRECFEQIGGYVPIKIGGVDLVAVITARMKGWQTHTFTEKICMHHRKIGTAAMRNNLRVAFKGGRGDYMLGGHPVWEFFRCIYQMTKSPVVLGGALRFAGFSWAMLRRTEKAVSPELAKFRGKEQMHRLKKFIGARIRGAKAEA